MRIILTAIFAITMFTAKSQTPTVAPLSITIKCHESFGYVTNMPGKGNSINFTFKNEEDATLYYVENFTYSDLYGMYYKNDMTPLARVKLVLPGYEAKPFDFVYSYSNDEQLRYYYFLRDHQEEKAIKTIIK